MATGTGHRGTSSTPTPQPSRGTIPPARLSDDSVSWPGSLVIRRTVSKWGGGGDRTLRGTTRASTWRSASCRAVNAVDSSDRPILRDAREATRPMERARVAAITDRSAPKTRCVCPNIVSLAREATEMAFGWEHPRRQNVRRSRCWLTCAGFRPDMTFATRADGQAVPVLSRGTPRYAQAVTSTSPARPTFRSGHSYRSRAAKRTGFNMTGRCSPRLLPLRQSLGRSMTGPHCGASCRQERARAMRCWIWL